MIILSAIYIGKMILSSFDDQENDPAKNHGSHDLYAKNRKEPVVVIHGDKEINGN